MAFGGYGGVAVCEGLGAEGEGGEEGVGGRGEEVCEGVGGLSEGGIGMVDLYSVGVGVESSGEHLLLVNR